MFLTDIRQVKNINWGLTHRWDIKFDDPTLLEFGEWFPATNIVEGWASLQTYQFEAYTNAYSVPRAQSLETIQITFADSVNVIVHAWLKNWIRNIIFNEGEYVSRLSDPEVVKMVTIKRVDTEGKDLKGNVGRLNYLVYPQGNLMYTGNSEGDVITNSVEFVIVDEVKSS